MATIALTPDLPEYRSDTDWRALRLFSLYRIILAGVFAVIVSFGNLPPPLGVAQPGLFAITAYSYLAGAVFAHVALDQRLGPYLAHLMGQVGLDLVALNAWIYASGGVSSGVGLLLVITVAAGSALAGGRVAIAIGALAVLAVLFEEFMLRLQLNDASGNYTQSGLLGAAFFATAALGQILARRVRTSEAMAEQTAVSLANLARVNEHIIQRMQSGIVVLDEFDRVRLLNEAARRLLGLAGTAEGRPIDTVAPELRQQLTFWRMRPDTHTRLVPGATSGMDAHAAFTRFGQTATSGTLVFLEDAALLRQRAQHLKLASLGRLAASIAHEIRNPLGAISHAGQLLGESPVLGPKEQRLTRIIGEQSKRMNRIVEDVLQVSRRDQAVPDSFLAKPWLEDFAVEFKEQHKLPLDAIALEVQPESIQVRMDASQLRQVLVNLCENAIRYSQQKPLVALHCRIRDDTQRPFLDVVDNGPGIPATDTENIFEPFFTTHAIGTGLGLYLARELCEASQALLTLHDNSSRGCCFRISFAHPDHQQISLT